MSEIYLNRGSPLTTTPPFPTYHLSLGGAEAPKPSRTNPQVVGIYIPPPRCLGSPGRLAHRSPNLVPKVALRGPRIRKPKGENETAKLTTTFSPLQLILSHGKHQGKKNHSP